MQVKITLLFVLLSGLTLSLTNPAQAQFITEQRPTTAHYLCNITRTRQSILLERWSKHEFPIKVYLPTPTGLSNHPLVLRQAVEKALSSWSKAWPVFTYMYVNQPVKNGIAFIWHEKVPSHLFHAQNHLSFYRAENKQIFHTNTVHLATRSERLVLGKNQKTENNPQEISNMAMHQIGHSLGLYHSDSDNDIMRVSLHYYAETYFNYTISLRDIQTLQSLYQLPYNLSQHPCPPKSN